MNQAFDRPLRLFVKTWERDFAWMKQAMIAANKTCKEGVKWAVCIDDGTRSEFLKVVCQAEQESGRSPICGVYETSEIWPEAMKIQNGYLRQQWIKMNSHKVMGEELFWIWDSDLIAQRPFSQAEFMDAGGKPIYWFSQFNSILGGRDDNAHYQRIQMIKDIFGIPEVPFEWMRCIPIPQRGGILRHGAGTSYWKRSFDMLVAGDERFSEFNVIGQFAHQYFPDAFDWRNTHNYPGKTFSGSMGDKNFIVSQGFSWGGLPESVAEFVKSL